MKRAMGGEGNHLAWVTKILKNPKRYSDYSVKCARQVAKERGIEVPEVRN